MILAAAVLLFQFPAVSGLSGAASHDTGPKSSMVAKSAAASDDKSQKALASSLVPQSAPEAPGASSKGTTGAVQPTTQPATTAATIPSLPIDPALGAIYLPPPRTFQPEATPVIRQGHAWFILAAAEHSAAGFDAWSTRQAVAQGRTETDPLMRPFAHSGAIYGAIQVLPVGLDFMARRMQRSSGWTRHIWWLPQSLATATFLFSGSYNFARTR